MSAETLTSLAMLKVHVDQGQDYLDYLRPFILQILVAHTPDPITDAVVGDHIRVSRLGFNSSPKRLSISVENRMRAVLMAYTTMASRLKLLSLSADSEVAC